MADIQNSVESGDGTPGEKKDARKKRGFSESRFVAGFSDLIADGEPEKALDYFIGELDLLKASKLNRKEKLNHLVYMSKIIQSNGNAKHGWQKLQRKSRQARRVMALTDVPRDKTFLDFGCGAHDPVSLSTFFYLNGFPRSVACDMRPMRNPTYSAISLYETLAEFNLHPEQFMLDDVEESDFKQRLSHFDTNKLAQGEIDTVLGGLSGSIDHRIDNLLNLDVDDDELGFVVSFAVLEHVDEIQPIMDWLYRKTAPGGAHFHFIDIADHRSYQPGGGFNAWSFLTEEDAPEGMNRLRKGEHLEAITGAGFEILQERSVEGEVPPETAEALLPRWKDMSKSDIDTIKLTVMFRKPAL
ncbi:methyltransferase domain-containing protein [Parasphingopyxis sp. CP4]|uniref:methyltransferase domain-containing protein n=1 Tax=Parasphingopyxis sp. CP4 TaxID=2724527 RepID=UPI0015A2BEAD|nr:methyltransferase domain-containing protein [Parasphingopyxis sp. CP4]QLC22989.1 methyltransferase domain-containing protein [Parasphingopyxis sp. CP4]